MLFRSATNCDLLPGFRAFTKNPNSWRNLEIVGTAYVKWMQANGPEAYAGFQAMVGGTPPQKA